MTPGRFPEISLLEVSEAFSSRVINLTPHMSALMDVFNNTRCPFGNKVQKKLNLSPPSELNIIKYLRLKLSLNLGHCSREGGRRNPSLDLGHLEMLIFLLDI